MPKRRLSGNSGTPTRAQEQEHGSLALHTGQDTPPQKTPLFSTKKDALHDTSPLQTPPTPPHPPVDMYLDTVDRTRLDFDFEKLCSISLSNLNVYACLICGKYFQGRGPSSHAYFHSLDEAHHVYINLHSLKIYVLPDSYEVRTNALDDIKYVLNPTYSRQQVLALDTHTEPSYDLDNNKYFPGTPPAAVLSAETQALSGSTTSSRTTISTASSTHCRTWRPSETTLSSTTLPAAASSIWNPRAFRAHVSPHELLQEVCAASAGHFRLAHQSDPLDFLSWLLNRLHRDLRSPRGSIVHRIFQGTVRIFTQQIIATSDDADRLRFRAAADLRDHLSPFLFLTLDLPLPPLLQDEFQDIIPQVPLSALLAKYDGSTAQELSGLRKRHTLTVLPPFLVFHIRRFTKNNWRDEKNPTIVTFPVRDLDMRPCTPPSPAVLTTDIDSAVRPAAPVLYDLCANIVHETLSSTDGDRRVFRTQVRSKSTDTWYQIHDLYVDEIPREMLFLHESYIQVCPPTRPAGH
ncbi:hypothetical protein PMAC_000292 [Pneumocystis sp. 'macacae']|nr:hypothetical protein PMAC_000292 [Pneumocystis sp. 'macacae']